MLSRICFPLLLSLDYEQSLFFLGPSSKTPETRKWPRAWLRCETGEARLFPSRAAALARACTPLTKSEEKERLLAGHIVPSWQISFACELKQRRRQRKRQKGTRDLISKTTTLQCVTLFGTFLCRHCATMNMVLNHLKRKFISLHTR